MKLDVDFPLNLPKSLEVTKWSPMYTSLGRRGGNKKLGQPGDGWEEDDLPKPPLFESRQWDRMDIELLLGKYACIKCIMNALERQAVRLDYGKRVNTTPEEGEVGICLEYEINPHCQSCVPSPRGKEDMVTQSRVISMRKGFRNSNLK